MATITSAQSGNWSTTTTWVGGVVPANGDTVTIANGHHIDFDVDQTGFANGLAGVTNHGTIHFPNNGPAVMHLKLNGDMGYGTLQFGDSAESPLPRTKLAKITIVPNDKSMSIDNLYVYGALPSKIESTIASDAAAGATQITFIDDIELNAGDEILLACSTNQSPTTVLHTVSAYNAETKTATLSVGLSHARKAGDAVFNFSAPVHFERASYSGSADNFVYPDVMYISGLYLKNLFQAIWYWDADNPTLKYVFANNSIISAMCYDQVHDHCYLTGTYASGCEWAYNNIFTNCVMVKGYCFDWSSDYTEIRDSRIYNGGNFVTQTNNSNCAYTCVIENCDIIDGNSAFLGNDMCGHVYNSRATFHTANGVASGNGVVRFSDGFTLKNVTFNGNFNYLADRFTTGKFIDCSINGSITGEALVEDSGDRSDSWPQWGRVEFYNWNNVQGDFKSFGPGGKMYMQNTTKYNGHDTLKVEHFNFPQYNNKAFSAWRDFPVLMPANKTMTFQVAAMKDFAGAGKVKLQIIDPDADPLMFKTATPLAEMALPDTTNEWAELSVSYKSSIPKVVSVRVISKNEGGNAYFYIDEVEDAIGEDRTTE